jgi:Flp pilus assembly pilin Flp
MDATARAADHLNIQVNFEAHDLHDRACPAREVTGRRPSRSRAGRRHVGSFDCGPGTSDADDMARGTFVRKYLRILRLPARRRQHALVRLTSRALRDDRGGEALEYALVAGLIVVGAIATIGCVGAKLVIRWNSANRSM